MWNENLVDFDLAGAGKLLQAGQTSEILELIIIEGLNIMVEQTTLN
jgi:hypothetical protein